MDYKTKKFNVNENGVINQKERNALRDDLMQNLLSLISQTYGYVTIMTSEGIVMEIENDDLGSIPAVVSIKIKNVNFDTLTAAGDYKEKLIAREQKEKEKQEKAKKKTTTAK